MLKECHKLDEINAEFSTNITDMEQKIDGLQAISFSKDTLKRQKVEYKKLKSDFNQLKQLFDELKDINERVIHKYDSNDISKIKVKYNSMTSRFDFISNQ
jgi:F0F1-type ATP synthase gamma subunit